MAKKYNKHEKTLLEIARRKMYYFGKTVLGLTGHREKLTSVIEKYKRYCGIVSFKSTNDFLLHEVRNGRLANFKSPPKEVKEKKRYGLDTSKIDYTGFPVIKDKEKKSYKEFLNGTYWKVVRNIVIKRDLGKCILCRTDKNLHVHHMTYKNHLNEHNHLDDLVTLCKSCHNNEHKKKDSKLIIK